VRSHRKHISTFTHLRGFKDDVQHAHTLNAAVESLQASMFKWVHIKLTPPLRSLVPEDCKWRDDDAWIWAIEECNGRDDDAWIWAIDRVGQNRIYSPYIW
jgi:hypothetical protein